MAEIVWETTPQAEPIQWEATTKPEPIQWEETENKKTLMNNVLDAFVDAGKNIKHGYSSSSAYMYDIAANVPYLINAANDYLVEKTGIGQPSDTTILKEVEKWLRNAARDVEPSEDERPKDILGKVYFGIGAAPGTIATYLPAIKGLGTVGGMAATEAVAAAQEGPTEMAKAGAKGAALGGTLKAIEPMARTVRIPTAATVGATQAAAEGAPMEDIVSSAIVMGGLGAIGPKEGMRLKDMKKPPPKLKHEAETIQKHVAETKTKEFAGNINLEKYNTETAVKQVLKDVAKEHESFIKARRGVVSHQETKKLAREMGMTEEQLLKRRHGQALNAHEAYGARVLLLQSANHLEALSKKAIGGADTDLVAFQKQLTRHVAIQEQVAAMTAEAGRALNQFKIDVGSSKAKVEAIKTIIESHGGRQRIEKIAEVLANPENRGRITELSRSLQKPKPIDMTVEAWINGLLSGPQTHVVNMTSNTLTALWTIPEQMIAAGLGKLHKGEKVRFRDAMARGYGFAEGAKEGIKRMATTLKTGEPLDPMSKLELVQHKAIPGKLGEVVRLPGRFLAAEDELFKAIGYRMELNSLASRKALEEGLKGRTLAKRIEELKTSPTEEMHLKAIETARYQTFTKPLGEFGRSIQSAAAAHPGVKFIMPFIRTPTNIIKFAGERTPFSLFSKEVRNTLKKGGVERDQQLGKIILGSMVSAGIASLVKEGKITGGGPSDPKQRAMLYATGWLPYSIKMDDQYYSYTRIEPLAMVAGISADAAEISEKMTSTDSDKIGAMIFASISKNLTSKTWLSGISDMIKAIEDPDRYGERWIQNYAGTVVPTLAAQYARTEDPILRETRTALDRIKSRIPYVSKSLLPRRNIWGEPIKLEGGLGPDIISPIYQSTIKNDKTSEEMVRLEIAPGMVKRTINGVELTPEQYDKYVRLAGEPAKKYLDTLVNHEKWESFPDLIKTEILKDGIREFRGAAKLQMLKDHKELLTESVNNKIQQFEQQTTPP